MLLDLIRFVPRRTFTHAVGALARRPVPRRLRPAVYGAFARRVGANLDEAAAPLSEYETFQDFFTRRLRAGLRPIGDAPVVSPADAVLVSAGAVERGTALQVKGRPYPVADLLGDVGRAAAYEGGWFATLYLHPRDYHRVHVPADGHVVASRHLPGALWPVNDQATRRIDRLFARNERLVTHLATAHGPLCVVMVAALGVGTVAAAYDRAAWGGDAGERRYDPALPVRRGDELGAFLLGSTVVLLGTRALAPALPAAGAPVRCGQDLARAAAAGGADG